MVIVCALLMVVMALMALSLFRSLGMQHKISGSTRDKQMALGAAMSAETYAEYQVSALGSLAGSTSGSACSGTSTTARLCSNALATPATLPWSTYNSYKPAGMNISASGGTNGNYYAAPGYYIQYLTSTSAANLYVITAYGYGGAANSVAVVQSTYQVAVGNACLSC